jgi:hypothetical protein
MMREPRTIAFSSSSNVASQKCDDDFWYKWTDRVLLIRVSQANTFTHTRAPDP